MRKGPNVKNYHCVMIYVYIDIIILYIDCEWLNIDSSTLFLSINLDSLQWAMGKSYKFTVGEIKL